MEQADTAPDSEREGPAHDRRRGPRRVSSEYVVDFERRRSDRRKRRPGLAALFGAIFGARNREQA